MLKLQNQAPSELETALRNISVTKILKEQDEAAVITIIASQLKRLIRMYQIPNVAGNEVELADWIYENYKYEEFALVYSVLKNPPPVLDEYGNKKTNWRLTPDTVSQWMDRELERAAAKRENDHHRLKMSDRDWELTHWNNEAWKYLYDTLKVPAQLEEQARQDVKEQKQKYLPVDTQAIEKRDEDYLKK